MNKANEKQSIQSVPHKLVCVPLNVISNNEPSIPVPISITLIDPDNAINHIDKLRDEISANKLCKGLSNDYIMDAMEKSTFLLYIIKTKVPRTIEGLVIVEEHDESLYIDLICGSSNYIGSGSYLIEQLKVIAMNMGKESLELRSVTDSVGFYIKKGFKCDELCDMKMKLKGGKRTRRRRQRKHSKTRKHF